MRANTFSRETLVPEPLLTETLAQMMVDGAVVLAVRFGKTMATIIVEHDARDAPAIALDGMRRPA